MDTHNGTPDGRRVPFTVRCVFIVVFIIGVGAYLYLREKRPVFIRLDNITGFNGVVLAQVALEGGEIVWGFLKIYSAGCDHAGIRDPESGIRRAD